jgi:hypothetical protein
VRESGSFDVPEDIRGLISRQADLYAMPDWGGSGRRLAAPLRFDRTTVGGRRHAGVKVLLATRPPCGPGWFWSIGPAAEPNGAG